MTAASPGGPPCPLCGEAAFMLPDAGDRDYVRCGICGKFWISADARARLHGGDGPEAHAADRELLSALSRHASERGEPPLEITGDNLDELIRSAPVPHTPLDALENLLLYMGERQKTFSDYVRIEGRRFPITVARSFEDFRYVANLLLEMGFAEVYDDAFREQLRLTAAGWKRLEELRASRPDSRRAFVAMWYAPELRSAWADGIRPALEEAGFTAVRLDAVEHNEQIDDRIIVEIRRAGLVVADLTGGRGNVYFEAGFALGLGTPVIWTCREDHLDDLHFDTRQYNYIAWSTPAELRERLRLRVEATLPRKNAGDGTRSPS